MVRLEESVAAFVEARSSPPLWTGVPNSVRPATIEDGYRLQRAIHHRLGTRGVSRVGYKIGSTSVAGQRVFGLSEPIYAGIFKTSRADTLAAALARPLAEPSLECEIAFRLCADIDGSDPGWSELAIADAVGSCHIACEIIDNRYGDPLSAGVPSLLADDFFHAGFVIGEAKQDWRECDLGTLEAAIEIDDVRVSGNARDVLAALKALRWLVQKLAAVGERLRVGETVLTGSITVPTRIKIPARAVALSIEGFEPLVLGGPLSA
jgi:2-keto-4-pentenoate hydratase